MRLKVESTRIKFDATRRDDPPALIEICYQLIFKSSEPAEKLQELADPCFKWGTVINMQINGLVPQGELVIQKL